ncbi:hypothetical protein ANAPC1_01113 [Anaplasma phagocytophilum]|uniref:Uncharacterized protein n=1 Tax=Anaplasma phagocytophilum TaxID=948 RepID=A0AA45UTM0_ANAPH|nr:hypothetical protein ANAPC1_01113 [Anaplasma phagocytophilum]
MFYSACHLLAYVRLGKVADLGNIHRYLSEVRPEYLLSRAVSVYYWVWFIEDTLKNTPYA